MEIALTADELKGIDKDNNGKSMLTDEQVMGIATIVNSKINIPILNEKKEQIVFCKIVRLIDTKLYEILPNEYYELINNLEDGITDKEAEIMNKRLTKLLNRKINIPILNEKKEAKLIKKVLSIIINALRKNTKL